MNHRALLKKYMGLVSELKGVRPALNDWSREFTDEEWEELLVLDDELWTEAVRSA